MRYNPGRFSTSLRTALTWIRTHPAFCIFAVALLLVAGNRYLAHSGDFEVFQAGALRYLWAADIHLNEPGAFTYPTAAALLMTPLGALSHPAAKLVFFAANWAMLLLGLGILHRHLGAKAPLQTWAVLLAGAATLRFMLSGFNNQQTDPLVFGCMMLGLHFLSANRLRGGLFMALAAAIKANPLFMVLMPMFLRRWIFTLVLCAACLFMALAPDASKYLLSESTENTELILPATVIAKNPPEYRNFAIRNIELAPLAYLQQYVQFTFNRQDKSWWNAPKNSLNQSLTRVVQRNISTRLPGNAVLLALCAAFAVALWLLCARRPAEIFVIGLLFYLAFVLIGPMASKPHFLPLYGLLLYAWNDVITRFSYSKAVFLTLCTAGLTLTSRGVLGDYAYVVAEFGHIGIIGFAVWLHVYWLIWNEPDNSKPGC